MTTEIAKLKPVTFESTLTARASEIKNLLPVASAEREAVSKRMMRSAVEMVRRTPALLKCEPISVYNCFVRCAELNLIPGPTLGHAYFVPYGPEATLIIGYRGLIELVHRSGAVDVFRAVAVRDGDRFEHHEGLQPSIVHRPAHDGSALKYVYAVAKLKSGEFICQVMTVAEVDKIRARSRAGQSGPWVTDYEAMALKTVARRLAKWLPMSSEQFEKALDIDNEDYIDASAVERTAEQAERTLAKDRIKAKALEAVTDVVEAPKKPAENKRKHTIIDVPAEPGTEGCSEEVK